MFLEPGILFKDHKRRRFLTFRLYLFSVVSLTVIFMMIKIVPPGYVGLIVRRDGRIDQFNNKGRLAMLYIPFLEVPVAFRTTPIRKKIVERFVTKDGQEVEVCGIVFLCMPSHLCAGGYFLRPAGKAGLCESDLHNLRDELFKGVCGEGAGLRC